MTETRSTFRRSTRQRPSISRFASFVRTRDDTVVSLEGSRKVTAAPKKRKRAASPLRAPGKVTKAAVQAEVNTADGRCSNKQSCAAKASKPSGKKALGSYNNQKDKRTLRGRAKVGKEDMHPECPSSDVVKPATPNQGSPMDGVRTRARKPPPSAGEVTVLCIDNNSTGLPASTAAVKQAKTHSVGPSRPNLGASRSSPPAPPITPSPVIPTYESEPTTSPTPTSKPQPEPDWFDPTDDDVLKAAKLAFQASAGACAPTLMCRDEQLRQLSGLVRSHLSDTTGGSIYVSGLPGTGKSLTCSQVLRACPVWAAESPHAGRPLLVWVNCMSLLQPRHIFQRVLDGIQVAEAMSQRQYDDDPITIPTASEGATGAVVEKLEKLLCGLHMTTKRKGSRPGMVVLVLDELDSLQTGDQSTLSELFLLTAKARSRLVLIGISNSIDLTERTLPHLKETGVSPTLVPFPAYSQQSLLALLKQREDMLPGPVLAPKAMEFAARKVGSGSGDMRQLLQAARCAIDALAEDAKEAAASTGARSQPSVTPPTGSSSGGGGNNTARPTRLVGIRHMAAGVSQLQGSCGVEGAVNSIQKLSREQQTVLCAAANILLQETNNGVVGGEGRASGPSGGKAKNLFRAFSQRKPWFPSKPLKQQKSGSASEASSGQGCTVAALHDMYLKLSRQAQIPSMHALEFSSVCRNLSDLALLQIGSGKNERQRRVSLKISTEDILMALQHVSLFRRMLSHLWHDSLDGSAWHRSIPANRNTAGPHCHMYSLPISQLKGSQ